MRPRFKDLATRIAEAFYHPHDHTYGVGNQVCHALALELGVVQAEARQAVLEHLVEASLHRAIT